MDENRFVVGNDEDNILRIYNSQTSGKILTTIDLNLQNYFDNNPKNKEIDVEAVSEINGIHYWITSHGRSKKGNRKKERHQFLATKITSDESILEQVGKSYTQLVLPDMIQDSQLNDFDFITAETISPKEKGGLNIEGLTTTVDGDLLIAFRNPIPKHKALLLSLKNPQDLIDETKDIKAHFGQPLLLDLDGLGIRSIEFWSVIKAYLIIAGSFDGEDKFALYIWSGKKEDQPEKISIQFPEQFRPESILFYPQLSDRFHILSDDGTIRRVDNQRCKDIEDENHPQKYFRSLWVKVDSLANDKFKQKSL